MLLWVSIALLTLVVTAVVIRPLLSRRPAPAETVDDDLERRLSVFRDRRGEIAREQAAGRLTEVEAEQARDDLLRQMAQELPADALAGAVSAPEAAAREAERPGHGATGPAPRAPLFVALAIAILLPLLGVGVYRVIGSPELALAQLEGRLGDQAGSPQAQFDALVAEVEARLKANPQDGEAWAVLAEAYKLIGNHGAAIEAFEKAVALLPPDARLLADYAESTALLAGGDFSGKPTELLERALQADPNDQKAVALMGAAKFRAGDLAQARRYLGQLLASLPPGSAEATQIGEVVAQIDSDLAARGAPGASSPPGVEPSIGSRTAPTPPAGSVAPAGAATLGGTVSLSPALASRLPAGATLFVVARAAEGPRIPIAVLRMPASAAPQAFELGDANAMDPSRPLSSASAIALEARISASGEAMRKPGDLYAEAIVVKPGASGIALVIDKVVEP